MVTIEQYKELEFQLILAERIIHSLTCEQTTREQDKMIFEWFEYSQRNIKSEDTSDSSL